MCVCRARVARVCVTALACSHVVSCMRRVGCEVKCKTMYPRSRVMKPEAVQSLAMPALQYEKNQQKT